MQRFPGKVAWLEWNAARIQRTEAFATSFFGWERRPMHLHPWGHMSLLLNRGVTFANTFMAMGHFAPAQWNLYLSADIDDARGRIEDLGGMLRGEPDTVSGWGRNQSIEDPQGNRLTLHEREGGDVDDPPHAGDPACAELWAEDGAAAARFYAELLGLERESTAHGFRLCSGGQARLFVRDNPYHPPPNRWIPYFRSASVGADVRRALLHDALPFGAPEQLDGLGKLALFADPAGAIFGLTELES